MGYLALTDLFLVGLALDITGAWLLAKGLLISAVTIHNVSATLWNGNPETMRDRCKSRVDAEFGLTYLLLGFALQALGYSLEIGGASIETGAKRLIAALVLALGFASLAVGSYYQFRTRWVERLIGEAEDEAARQKQEKEHREESERKIREAEASS